MRLYFKCSCVESEREPHQGLRAGCTGWTLNSKGHILQFVRDSGWILCSEQTESSCLRSPCSCHLDETLCPFLMWCCYHSWLDTDRVGQISVGHCRQSDGCMRTDQMGGYTWVSTPQWVATSILKASRRLKLQVAQNLSVLCTELCPGLCWILLWTVSRVINGFICTCATFRYSVALQ